VSLLSRDEFVAGEADSAGLPKVRVPSMATDQGVSITACTSAKKVGASDAIGLPSSPNFARSLRRGHAHALAVDGIEPADCVADWQKPVGKCLSLGAKQNASARSEFFSVWTRSRPPAASAFAPASIRGSGLKSA
jgi:hypothetical protein